jgi:hypothetical protein
MEMIRFGQFLINNGVVDDENVFEGLNIQRKWTPPIGKVAIKEKLLSVKDIMSILYHQAGSAKMFGELAVEMQFLNEEQVGLLLEMQRASRPRIGEILVEMGVMSNATLDNMVEKFHNQVAS